MLELVSQIFLLFIMIYRNMRKKAVRKIFCGYYLICFDFWEMPFSVFERKGVFAIFQVLSINYYVIKGRVDLRCS
jgi:hypothetical protein